MGFNLQIAAQRKITNQGIVYFLMTKLLVIAKNILVSQHLYTIRVYQVMELFWFGKLRILEFWCQGIQ